MPACFRSISMAVRTKLILSLLRPCLRPLQQDNQLLFCHPTNHSILSDIGQTWNAQ